MCKRQKRRKVENGSTPSKLRTVTVGGRKFEAEARESAQQPGPVVPMCAHMPAPASLWTPAP